jgi:hypothetical protein
VILGPISVTASRRLRFLFTNMKKSQKTVKRSEGKKQKANRDDGLETLADRIESIVFGDTKDPETRIEKLEHWRGRLEGTRANLFQPDVMRLVETAITNNFVTVYLPITLPALEWQRLITNGIDEAREWMIVNSSNKVNDQWRVPEECGVEGVLARMIVHAIRKAASLTRQATA